MTGGPVSTLDKGEVLGVSFNDNLSISSLFISRLGRGGSYAPII
jgi:hypothetical protein